MISRRNVMKCLGILSGMLVLYPVRRAFPKSLELALSKVDRLESVGGSVTLKIKGKDVLFIRDTETTVRALDPTCTHKGCKVAFKRGANRIECPCHQSIFDAEGRVLGGPARRNLKNYGAKLEDQKIIFSLD